MTVPSPFHAGERAVQCRVGVREIIEPWARKVVRTHLPAEHREFYAALPYLVVAARDLAGRPWATVLAGDEGFVSTPNPGVLRAEVRPVAGDALEAGLVAGADVGILGIELATRRRNRVNGRIVEDDGDAISIAVDQAFGNCPQYIRERAWYRATPPAPPKPAVRSRVLSAAQQHRVRAADTLFIASGHRGEGDSPAYGMDASHRGGSPGFVRIVDGGHLAIPDYAGNNHFNTVGNLVVDPRAGLVFVDFETGGMLQLTGHAEIDWDSDDVATFPGARRVIHFEIDEVVDLEAALPLRWDASAAAVRSLRLVDKHPESDDVVSFVFEARDGGPLAEFEAGQHLPIELHPPGRDPVWRTYSLSNGPAEGRYRISVKREPHGVGSRWLHDDVEVGAIIDSRTPAGEFIVDHGHRRVALISAGIGVTPMVSMLHDLVSRHEARPISFIHGARDGHHHALAAEARALAARMHAVSLHVSYSRPGSGDVLGRDYHREGRVDGALVASLVPDLDAEFYLCGPISFMAAVQTELERRGVDSDQIHTESFGPQGQQRRDTVR